MRIARRSPAGGSFSDSFVVPLTLEGVAAFSRANWAAATSGFTIKPVIETAGRPSPARATRDNRQRRDEPCEKPPVTLAVTFSDALDPAPSHFGDRGLVLCASIRLDDRLPAPYPSEKPSSRTFALD